MKEGPPALAVILIAILQNAHTLVPGEFDVKVSCHNFETTVYWNYDRDSLRPFFRVQILKDINNADSETTGTWFHHQNISSSVTHIEESYYVNVSAMNGSEMSTSVVSPQFSYHKYLPAEIRCTLDFPNVTLSVKGGQITFTFSHPYQVYKDTPTVKNLNRLYSNGCIECKKFKYRILYNGTDTLHNEKICVEEVCKGTVQVPGNSEVYCISLSGTMLNTKSGIICQPEEPQTSWIYVIPIAVCIMTISFALIMIVAIMCSITKKTLPSLPMHLVFMMHRENTMIPKDYNGHIVRPLIYPKPHLQTPKELVPVGSPILAAPQDGSRFPIGQAHLENWSSNQEAMHLIDLREPCHKVWSDQSRQLGPTEEHVEDCSGSLLCSSLSGYDRPQALEISPGDIVDGYGPHDDVI